MQKEFVKLPVNDIHPYPNNPRINDEAVAYVVESMNQTGNLDPIEVDEDNVILSGHTRLLALEQLGITETECVRYTGLTEEQKKKYRLLANKTAEVSTWDEELLNMELGDLDFGGFDFGFELSDGGVDKPKQSDNEDDETTTHFNYSEQYGVIVMCADEAEQEQIYNRLTDEGFTCKVVAV